MLETLISRKETLQAQGKKGFTLMEMLIVIAIIAVLIAIAIPIFSSQLENAQEATDAANLRSAYATASVQSMQLGKTVSAGPVKISQADKTQWTSSVKDEKIGGVTLPANMADSMYVIVKKDGEVKIESTAVTGDDAVTVDPVTGKTTS